MKKEIIFMSIMVFMFGVFLLGFSACKIHKHIYKKAIVEPTCSEQGYTVYTCECGDSYKDDYIDALGHEFINYISDNNATMYSDGTETAFCEHGCGTKNTVERSLENLIEKENFYFPIMDIKTENCAAIESKEEYINCTVSVSNTDEKFIIDKKIAGIRGRGNTTWTMPKKPYRIKFKEKTDLFGFGKAKSWVLIANYGDQSLLRNALAYATGKVLGEEYTTETQFVNLYLNDKYQGLYLLCEQTETGKTRVNISEKLDDVDTGYLIEFDHKLDRNTASDNEYFMIGNTPYCIKDPDADDEKFTQAHYDFIKNYIIAAFAAADGDYSDVEEYFDISSWMNCYITHELFHCCDVGNTSFFIYKDAGGKLCCGPIWDFDVSSGNCSYAEGVAKNDCLWAIGSPWYNKLLQHDEFRAAVSERLNQKSAEIENKINELCENFASNSYDFETNFVKWEILGKTVWPNTQEIGELNSWGKHVAYLREWLLGSLEYMVSVYVV